MATYQAIGSMAQAVVQLLAQSWDSTVLGGIHPQFEVYQGRDFHAPMDVGLSVFVYRVELDTVQRTYPPADANHRNPLPLQVSFLLTPWAQDVSAEHVLLGWGMRAIADNPILSSGFLNAAVSGVYRPEETVELVPVSLSNDEIFQLWQVLPSSLQLSTGYQGRVVRIESELVDRSYAPVRTREFELATP
jgi:hypothetical protein